MVSDVWLWLGRCLAAKVLQGFLWDGSAFLLLTLIKCCILIEFIQLRSNGKRVCAQLRPLMT